MRITVTEEHIREGNRKDSCTCPVALAIREAVGYKSVSVTEGRIIVGFKRMDLPERVLEFVEQFDKGNDPLPFSFDLTLEVDGSAALPQVDESH